MKRLLYSFLFFYNLYGLKIGIVFFIEYLFRGGKMTDLSKKQPIEEKDLKFIFKNILRQGIQHTRKYEYFENLNLLELAVNEKIEEEKEEVWNDEVDIFPHPLGMGNWLAKKKLINLYLRLTPQFNPIIKFKTIFTTNMLKKAYLLSLDTDRPVISDVDDMVDYIKKKYDMKTNIPPAKYISDHETLQAWDMIEAGLDDHSQLLLAYEVFSMPRYSKFITEKEMVYMKKQIYEMLTNTKYDATDFKFNERRYLDPGDNYLNGIKHESFMEMYDLFVASGLRQVDGGDIEYNIDLVHLLREKLFIYSVAYDEVEIYLDSPVNNKFVEDLHNFFRHCVADGYRPCKITPVETEKYFANWFERIGKLHGMELYYNMVLYMKYFVIVCAPPRRAFMDIHFNFYLSPLLMKIRERVEFNSFDVATALWLWNRFDPDTGIEWFLRHGNTAIDYDEYFPMVAREVEKCAEGWVLSHYFGQYTVKGWRKFPEFRFIEDEIEKIKTCAKKYFIF